MTTAYPLLITVRRVINIPSQPLPLSTNVVYLESEDARRVAMERIAQANKRQDGLYYSCVRL